MRSDPSKLTARTKPLPHYSNPPPLVHLPRLSLSKSRFLRLAPLLSPSPLVFVNNQLCDYTNEVINYCLFLPLYHRLARS